MNDLIMDFEVYTDLKKRKEQYNVKIKLESATSNAARELAINRAGTIIRNNEKLIYGKKLSDNELASKILEDTNRIIGEREPSYKAKGVAVKQLKIINKKVGL